MDAKLRFHYTKQVILSFLLIIPTIPYIYILYRLSLFFLEYHGWSIAVLIYPLLWILFQTVRGTVKAIRKTYLSGYVKLDPDSNHVLAGIYGSGETAYAKLARLTRIITSQININPHLTFYVYPHGGKHRNNHFNVAIFKEKRGFGLLISQKTLEDYSDETILGVLAHELSHSIASSWYQVIGIIMGCLMIPSNAFVLFLAVSIGFYSWWLFVPALIVLGLIHMSIVGLPFKVDEISADELSAKLG